MGQINNEIRYSSIIFIQKKTSDPKPSINGGSQKKSSPFLEFANFQIWLIQVLIILIM